MRTKTLALSSLLGALGTTSLFAQANVYSLNAVGYINVTMPPGYSLVTCPLIVGTDTEYASTYGGPAVTNDLNVVFNNDVSAGTPYKDASVFQYVNGVGFGNSDSGAGAGGGGGWAGGTLYAPGPSFSGSTGSQSDIGQGVTLLPGQAVFFYNGITPAANMTATFVGTVPQGSLTNILVPGYNLVGSMVPTSGDFVVNTIMGPFMGSTVNSGGPPYVTGGQYGPANGDSILFYDTVLNGGSPYGFSGPGCNPSWSFGSWSGGNGAGSGNPETIAPGNVSQGFLYDNAGKDDWSGGSINGFSAPAGTEIWIENFTINP